MITPVRQRLLSFVSPLVADFLVSERVSTTRMVVPEYKSPHPDVNKYPNHFFVYATVADEEGLSFDFIYAAEREYQDLYNWEVVRSDIGGTKFDSVQKTYIILRDDFVEGVPAMGDSMVLDEPDGLFNGEYVLALRKQIRTSDKELDSAFVIEQQTFVKRCTISDISTDRTLGVGVTKSTDLYYRGEVVSGSDTIDELFEDADNAYWGSQTDGSERAGQQISDSWFAVITTSSLDAALLAFKQVTPSTVDLQLPSVLESVSVVWNKSDGEGEFNSEWSGLTAYDTDVEGSLNGAESASADASASIQPELVINISNPEGRDIPSRSCFFFMKLVSGVLSEASFLTRLGEILAVTVNRWPTFNPESHTIVTRGQKVSVAAKASASAAFSVSDSRGNNRISYDKNEGSGTDFDVSTMTGSTRIPPTIHGAITVSGTLTDTATAQATCDVGWTGTGSGDFLDVDGTSYPITFPSTTAAADTGAVSAAGSVTPTSFSATSPAAIPASGYYAVRIKIDPYDSVWQRCYAEVINAADI